MRTPFTLRTFAVAAVASSLLLSACGDSDSDEGTTPPASPDATSGVVESPDAETPSDGAPDQQESLPPQPSSTRDTVDAGVLEGDELNAAGIAWFGAFCSGIGEVSKYGVPDTQEMSVPETAEAVSTTYMQFGEGFDAAAKQLASLDSDMNFENADAFASEAVDSLNEVSSVYASGADTVKAGTYSAEEDLIGDVREIETEAVESGAGDFGLSSLDESVFDAVDAQVPACASS